MKTKPSPYPGEPPLRDFDILPDRISSNVEEFRVEAWTRMDRRIRLHDITDRIHPNFRMSKNTLQQRGVRFRQAFDILAWGSGSRKTQEIENEIRNKLINRNIDPASNSTRGLTPGLIDPNLGESGGRIPVPEQFQKRYSANTANTTVANPITAPAASGTTGVGYTGLTSATNNNPPGDTDPGNATNVSEVDNTGHGPTDPSNVATHAPTENENTDTPSANIVATNATEATDNGVVGYGPSSFNNLAVNGSMGNGNMASLHHNIPTSDAINPMDTILTQDSTVGDPDSHGTTENGNTDGTHNLPVAGEDRAVRQEIVPPNVFYFPDESPRRMRRMSLRRLDAIYNHPDGLLFPNRVDRPLPPSPNSNDEQDQTTSAGQTTTDVTSYYRAWDAYHVNAQRSANGAVGLPDIFEVMEHIFPVQRQRNADAAYFRAATSNGSRSAEHYPFSE